MAEVDLVCGGLSGEARGLETFVVRTDRELFTLIGLNLRPLEQLLSLFKIRVVHLGDTFNKKVPGAGRNVQAKAQAVPRHVTKVTLARRVTGA
jgi:hypothetical protein